MKRNLPFLALTVLALTVLISLGNWQVARKAEKEAYLAAIDARLAAEAVDVPQAPEAEADQFLAVTATGRFTGTPLRVLVSTRDYGAGYRIIQAFETDGGRRLMADRGYIRSAQKDATLAAGAAALSGNLHWPSERDSYTPEDDVTGNSWYARDVEKMAQALGTEPVLIVVRNETPPTSEILPLPLDTSSIPNRHLEYIITWYGLALVWVLMTAYFLTRKRAKDTP